MQLTITPAGGGQPVVLGLPGSTQQGALNLAAIVDGLLQSDLVLIVRAGQLAAITAAALFAALSANTTPSPLDLTVNDDDSPFLLLGVA